MSEKQEFDLLAGAEQLPAEGVWRGSRRAAVGMFFIAAVALGMAVWGVSRGAGLPFVAFGGIVGVAMLLFGVSRLIARREYRFTSERVACNSRSLLGGDRWEEPLSAYSGIRREAEHHHRRKGADYTLHRLILKHGTDDSRDVTLYQSLRDRGLRGRQEEYARMFELPALVETQDGLVERRPEDLDKPLRQRVAEGSVAVDFDARQEPPGRGLLLFVEGDTLRICTGREPMVLLLGVPPVLFGAAVLLAEPLGLGPLQAIPGAVGVVALVVGAALIAWFFLGRQELLVSASEVRRHYRWAGATFARQRVAAEEVEEVIIATPPGQRGVEIVQVISDTDVASFGATLSPEQRRWVRDCIIAVIGAGSGRAEGQLKEEQ